MRKQAEKKRQLEDAELAKLQDEKKKRELESRTEPENERELVKQQ